MYPVLSDAELRRFHEDGVVVLAGLFAFEEIAWLRHEAVAAGLRQSWPSRRVGVPEPIRDLHRREPAFHKLAHHPRLLEPARQLLSREAAIAESTLLSTPTRHIDNADGLLCVVGLGGRAAESGLGNVVFSTGRVCAAALQAWDVAVAIRYVAYDATVVHLAAGRTGVEPPMPEADDCLWQSPLCVAG
ncbi:MAG: hypothetical protein HY246_26755 [Proteobacteria bacterium]|nr:hypothetical protein [Pseudomonadota bacterium]